jgi:xanthine dehydrogenase YagT iron-sulfur-binding subunit
MNELPNPKPETGQTIPITRREFVSSSAVAAGSLAASVGPNRGGTPLNEANPSLSLTVNGIVRHLNVDPRTTLLDLLRENLHLTGTKKGCDRGQCGACTVLAGGRRIKSCLSLALTHERDAIVTIEGVGTPNQLHRVQQAFLDHDAFQCGYCTPGQICSAVSLIEECRRGEGSILSPAGWEHGKALTRDEIRERMSGNLCRCSAYANIVAAVEASFTSGVEL